MRKATLMATCLILGGCAELSSIHRSYNAEPEAASILSVDAKQRNVLITPHLEADKRAIVCSEPNPDFASVLASSLSGGFGNGDSSAQVAAALSETGANIGLRTQSIQLLRDAMYRLCEGYAAGAIDKADFHHLHLRYQAAMVSILAIEQLTGYARPTTVIIGTNAAASGYDGLAIAQKQLDDARKQQAEADQKLADAKKADQDAGAAVTAKEKELQGADQAQKPALEAERDKLKQQKTTTEAALKLAQKAADDAAGNVTAKEEARAKAMASTATAQGFGLPAQITERPAPDAAATAHVANAVVSILNTTLEQDWVRQHCLDIMKGGEGSPQISPEVRDLCISYIRQETVKIEIKTEEEKFRLDKLKKAVSASSARPFVE